MSNHHVIIIGGGLAGLSAGCYARASGYRTTIVEHNLALGGVCTAWKRGPYTIDGCIHWLTGGPFDEIYRELGILPKVSTHTLDLFTAYRDVRSGVELQLTRDLEAFGRALSRIAPEDVEEIRRIVEGAASIAALHPPIEQPPELSSMRESLARLWEMRGQLGTLAHFRKPIGVWAEEHLKSAQARKVFACLLPAEAPALFLLLTLSYLSRGWLSRPDGGTGRFRDALIDTYHTLGGEERLHSTVDEVIVEDDRARGVRLADGTIVEGDVVVSTASAPETVLRLLGGRYGAGETRKRLDTWKLFEPIVLASYGLSTSLSDVPSTILIDGIEPLDIGGRKNDHLYVRIYNDDPAIAPPGHTVVQAMLTTNYDWWAKRGSSYNSEKDAIGETVRRRLEEHLPAMRGAVAVVDIATPLTYWNMARSWRGAFEGWMPTPDEMFGHVDKTLPGLLRFYMAGQWVEPGGGVPTALMSGRHVMQLICANEGHRFVVPFAQGSHA